MSDDGGRPLGRGKDLAALRRDLLPSLRETLSRAAAGIERHGLRDWEVGALPQVFERVEGGQQVRGYPALVDEGDSVAVRVLETEAEQRRAMWAGTRRLILLGAGSPSRRAVARLDNETKLVLGHNPHGSVSALLADCMACAADALIAEHGGPAWDGQGFAALRTAVLAGLDARLLDVLGRTRQVLAAAQDAERRLAATTSTALTTSVQDAREQFAGLVYPGFVAASGWSRLPDLGRYLRALSHRLDRLPDRPGRDQELMATVHRVQQAYREVLAGLSPERRDEDGVGEIRWMLEELRVSLFAQTLRAAYPVSEKRVMAAIAALRVGADQPRPR